MGVVVNNTDQKQSQEICALLNQLNYRATSLQSLGDLEKHLQGTSFGVAILDPEELGYWLKSISESQPDSLGGPEV